MTFDQAHWIYDLLVVAGATTETWRADFVLNLTDGCREYRLSGSLGAGSKLYVERDRWRVGCYREDETPERLEKIKVLNRVLARMREAIQ